MPEIDDDHDLQPAAGARRIARAREGQRYNSHCAAAPFTFGARPAPTVVDAMHEVPARCGWRGSERSTALAETRRQFVGWGGTIVKTGGNC